MKKDLKEKDESERILISSFPNVKTFNASNVYTDLHVFKLEEERMLKNVSPFKKDPMIQHIEHCHIYRTKDPHGKEETKCSSVGGHYHEIEIYEDGPNLKAKCGPPKTNKGSRELLEQDKHTHKITYIGSQEVKLRVISPEAAKYLAERIK